MISDEREKTVCPMTLKETDMMEDNCTKLEVYAKQYGVQSEKKAYIICYHSKKLCTFLLK